MPPTGPLSDLLGRYLARRARGEPVAVEDLCHDAPELLADLRRAVAVVETMEQGLRATGRQDSAADRPAGPPLPPGTTVAGYELLAELGRGGMGVVYLARQVSLGRLVALKMFLAGGFRGAEGRARFLAEAAAVARLRHPHVVQVFESGTHDGRPYFSMELCEAARWNGGCGAGRCRRGRPPRSWRRWPRAPRPPTRWASSTATSSPATSSWPAAGGDPPGVSRPRGARPRSPGSSPRSAISAWPGRPTTT